MATKLVRPYKMSADKWVRTNRDELRDSNGREMYRVAIGEIFEGSNVVKVEELFYKDILFTALKNGSPYKTTITLGRNPQLTITCDGNVVLHNPQMIEIKKNIIKAINYIPQDITYAAMEEMRLNKERLEKRGKNTNLLMSYLGKQNTNYPVELVCAIVLENLCIDKRTMENELQNEIRVLDYESFLRLSMQTFSREQTKVESVNADVLKEMEEKAKELSLEFADIAYYVKEEAQTRLIQGYLREGV